jgi:hypothetical protein
MRKDIIWSDVERFANSAMHDIFGGVSFPPLPARMLENLQETHVIGLQLRAKSGARTVAYQVGVDKGEPFKTLICPSNTQPSLMPVWTGEGENPVQVFREILDIVEKMDFVADLIIEHLLSGTSTADLAQRVHKWAMEHSAAV